MATEVDFSVDQGATFIKYFTIYNQQNVVVNLAGFTGLMEVRPNVGSPLVTWTANTQDGANTMFIDSANGNVSVNFVDATFQNLLFTGATVDTSSQDFVYDLRLTNNIGQTFVVASGTLTINRAVTQ